MARQKLLLVSYADTDDADMDSDMAELVLQAFNSTHRRDGGRLLAVEDLYPADSGGFDYIMSQVDEWNDMDDAERREFLEARDAEY